MQLLSTGLLSLCSKDLEEKGEDVDDIQVDVESGEDVFFWTHGVPLVPHKELGIKCQKHGKQYSPQHSIDTIHPGYILEREDKGQHQARDEHHHAEDKKHTLV